MRMRVVSTLAKRELRSALVTPLAYVLVACFLISAGYFFFSLLEIFNSQLPQAAMLDEPVSLHDWVVVPFYSTLIMLLVFLIPLITARLFAEERQRGTFALIASAPISNFEIIFGKYLGSLAILLLMLLVTAIFPVALASYGDLEPTALFVGYIGVCIFAGTLLALGLALSTLIHHQAAGAVLGIIFFLLLYLIDAAAQQIGGPVGQSLFQAAPAHRIDLFLKGVIDFGDVVYFLSLTMFGLFVGHHVLEAQRASA